MPSRKIGPEIVHDGRNAIVDILFIHGLTGDRKSTWTYEPSSPFGKKVFWPKDLLSKDLPNSRIITFGYDADIVNFLSPASQNCIGDHARNLLNYVTNRRDNSNTSDRPLLIVAHSLGGLVAEDAILCSRNSAEPHLQNFHKCVKGICFLGTPHAGSKLAEVARFFARMANAVRTTNVAILDVLTPTSEVNRRIQQPFHQMLRESGHTMMDITCFFEELPLPNFGMIVDMHSAILDSYNSIGIHANHMNMTKFRSAEDPGYEMVLGELRRWIEKISTRVPSHQPPQSPVGNPGYQPSTTRGPGASGYTGDTPLNASIWGSAGQILDNLGYGRSDSHYMVPQANPHYILNTFQQQHRAPTYPGVASPGPFAPQSPQSPSNQYSRNAGYYPAYGYSSPSPYQY